MAGQVEFRFLGKDTKVGSSGRLDETNPEAHEFVISRIGEGTAIMERSNPKIDEIWQYCKINCTGKMMQGKTHVFYYIGI